jgi:hypothetical protein
MKFQLLILFIFPFLLFSQKYTISGTIKDASNGEDLIGATVSVKDKNIGASANVYGFYSLTLDKGEYTLLYRYFGYQTIERTITLNTNTTINIELSSVNGMLEEVVISAEREDGNVKSIEMSVTKLDPKSIEAVPVLFGEKDIMKTLQLTPGVKTAGEGNSGFYVRGGATDQNLILLDEAIVYNASHLLGFFSVFNSDAIKDVALYKGGIPSEYGGRGSSVMDVKMRDGNSKKFGATGGLGLISSRLTLEGPIVKDKGSFMLSGRRSYADIFLGLSKDEDIKTTRLYFYDLNLKANYKISDKDRVYVSGYFGRDVFSLGSIFGFDWGNATGTVRWNHLFSEKLFSNTSIIASNYDYQFRIGEGEEQFGIKSAIRDYNIKQSYDYFLNANNTIKFGANLIHHTFYPGELFAGSETSFNQIKEDNKYALEGGFYLQNEQKISELFSVQYGVRYSLFNYMGKGTAYEFDEDGDLLKETKYDDFKSIQYYGGFEPRLSVNYLLNEKSSIKASLNRNRQYLHLLSNSVTTSPTDLWVPSTNNVKPQIVDQVALGYFRNFKDNMFEFSVEAYYKTLANQIDYKNGANLVLNTFIEADLVYGRGKAYGTEFFLRKTKGNLTGWVGYTIARALRQFDEINNGEWFSARQDRIHDISIVGIYKFNEKLTASATWVYYTGDAVTFPSGRYEIDGVLVPYYTERNGYRFPNYHRLDVGVTWYNKKTAKFESSWNFSVYNAYARENAYSITFRQNADDPNRTEAVRIALFKLVPAITYNFKF